MPPEENADAGTSTAPPAGFPLHHIGLLVVDIDRYLAASHWTRAGDTVQDPLQNARLCLLRMGQHAGPLLELVEFLPRDGAREPLSSRRPGLHHLCFAVPTPEAGERWARRQRFLPVTVWKPAVLFGGRPVRFYYSRNRELLELLSETA